MSSQEEKETDLVGLRESLQVQEPVYTYFLRSVFPVNPAGKSKANFQSQLLKCLAKLSGAVEFTPLEVSSSVRCIFR